MSQPADNTFASIAAEITAQSTGFRRNPDGSVSINVTVPEDVATIIESWCEGSGESFAERLQRDTTEALMNYVMSQG